MPRNAKRSRSDSLCFVTRSARRKPARPELSAMGARRVKPRMPLRAQARGQTATSLDATYSQLSRCALSCGKMEHNPIRHAAVSARNHVSRSKPAACELCRRAGGKLLWRDRKCRVVLVSDPDYPGFCRVIWNAHVREMTDLSSREKRHCMRVVFAAERALRKALSPHKINLASFGNFVPHLHWHVIPRYTDDPHFPDAVWARRRRKGGRRTAFRGLADLRAVLARELTRARR